MMNFEVFDKLLDGVLIVDESLSIVYKNESFATIIGANLRRIKDGKKSFDYITFADNSLFLSGENGEWGKHSDTLYKEFEFKSFKGNKGHVSISIKHLVKNDQKVIICFMKDMSLEVQLQKKYRHELEQKEDVIEDLKIAQKELERYSQNLEKMVEKRTLELKESNNFIDSMINSLGQALLVFDKDNNCLPTYTNACNELFFQSPKDKKIWEVINLDEKEIEQFKKWSDSLFSELLEFEDIVALGPKCLIHPDGRYIELEYHPFKKDGESLLGVVTVGTDKTKEHLAEIELEKKQVFVDLIVKLVKNKPQFLAFVQDVKLMFKDLFEMIQVENINESTISQLAMLLHSIKGGAGLYNLREVQDYAHELENYLEKFKKLEFKDFLNENKFWKEKFQELKNITYEQFFEYKEFLGEGVVDGKARVELKLEDLISFSDQLLDISKSNNLQEMFNEKFINQSIDQLLGHYSELVYSCATQDGKKVAPIQFQNKSFKINPIYFGNLFNTLVHAFTNVVAHGLEDSELRKSIGKNSEGKIEVSVVPYYQNGKEYLRFTIEDDGKGIDPQVIRKKLEENGTEKKKVDSFNDFEIIQQIFNDQISSMDQVSSLAGRGVGMGAIKSVVQKMGGDLWMESIKGLGSKLVINVPNK